VAVVLVVEDEFLIRLNTVDMVEEAGFDTLEAGNADEALQVLEGHPEIAIVFTDINMPGSMNGIELAELVAEHWPRVRVVLTSGRVLLRDEDLPDEDRFIPKPFDEVQLSNVLRGLIH
jgi:two-component system, response regulator PdtaR